jgi:tetratricopeptide (TPR) repeat protein
MPNRQPAFRLTPAAPPIRVTPIFDQALAFHRAGLLAEAEQLYRRVLQAQPRHFDSLHMLGVIAHQRGEHARAVEQIDAALKTNARAYAAYNNRGLALKELGQLEEALASFRKAIRLKPDFAEAFYNCGIVLKELKQFAEAAASFEKAIATRPDYTSANYHRGDLLVSLQRHEEALQSFDRALALNPRHIDAIIGRANVLDKLGRPRDALAGLDNALAIEATHAGAVAGRAVMLRKLGCFDEALAACDRLLASDSANISGLTVRAEAMAHMGRHEEAVATLDRIIALRPEQIETKWNKSLLCLALGRFGEGWPLYEHRWEGAKNLAPRGYGQPRWNGGAVNGTLLIWGEQGLGDEILFAGMIAEVAVRTPSVVLEVEPRLEKLFARSFPEVSVIPRLPELYSGRIDAQEPMGGIGRYLRPSWDSFPRRSEGYLVADPARACALRARLAGDGQRIVGLSWFSRALIDGQSRSAKLADLEPLLRLPGCRFVDLQYGDTQDERDTIGRELGIEVERLADIDNTNDIDGLSALITACDAVVTVDNTTAHLAGALGRPTWVMVPYGHVRIWYWFRDRDDSLWYPRVHVRRQASSELRAHAVSALTREISLFLDSTPAEARR